MTTTKIPRGDYYCVTRAAEELGLTTGRVRQLIRAGQARAIKVTDRSWIISRGEVSRLKRLKRKSGQPRKV